MQKYQESEKMQGQIPIALIGAVLLVVLGAALLWTQNARTTQASMAKTMNIGFDGEYRIGEGRWQPVVAGEHISSTSGDVTLRGTFYLIDPYSGEYFVAAGKGTFIALYLNHLACTIQEPGAEPHTCDAENPELRPGSCGQIWSAYALQGEGGDPITIHLRNPHRFGNENAIDDFLNALTIYGGSAFEKQMEDKGKGERVLGLSFLLSAFAAQGIALFSSLLHIRQTRSFWQAGWLSFFGGGYFAFSADNVFFWSWSTVNNTTILGLCMMLYMLIMTWAAGSLLGKKTKRIGDLAAAVSGSACVVLMLLPIVSGFLYYDTWLAWAVAQGVACLMMIACLIREAVNAERKQRLFCMAAMLPMLAFLLDFAATKFGWWQGGAASKYVFVLIFAGMLIPALRFIPQNIVAVAKSEKLEAELQESRAAIMMSQIRPHFIYNTLGSIEELCEVQPKAAASLVHNFARYLRGSFSELDNYAPIRMSKEMEHVRCYVSIEQVRFPDITVEFNIQSEDFLLPALSVQPLVENAIKHGLMKLPQGGTVTVSAFETDTHYCVCVQDNGGGFDSANLWEDRKHVGLRNIRGRVEAMCGGTLTVESKPGSGTKVTILLPREGKL